MYAGRVDEVTRDLMFHSLDLRPIKDLFADNEIPLELNHPERIVGVLEQEIRLAVHYAQETAGVQRWKR